MDVTVKENADAHRYEAITDGDEVAGFVEYVDHRGTRLLFHTEVDAAALVGVGSTLAREVLDQALGNNLTLRVTCPFLKGWIERHPEYVDRVTLG